MELLSVKNLSISFGGLKAVDNFNISIEKGQLYGLIGPNGAGKTTVFNLLTGVYQPDSGSIVLDGRTWWARHRQISARAVLPEPSRTSVCFPGFLCWIMSNRPFTMTRRCPIPWRPAFSGFLPIIRRKSS